MQELQYLNLAINNITKVQNLQRCESLARLDLTMNFVTKTSLPTVASLASNIFLTEFHLVGNPCIQWVSYRPFVIASVPQLEKLVRSTLCHIPNVAYYGVPALQTTMDEYLQNQKICAES